MADPYTFTFDVEALLSGQDVVEEEAPKEGVMKRPVKEAEAKTETPTESIKTRLANALKTAFPNSSALGTAPQGDTSVGRNKALTDWTVSTEAFIPKYRGDVPSGIMLDTPPVSTTDLGPDMGTLSMQDAQEQAAIRSVSGITESLGRPSGTATTEVDGLMSAPDVESESGVSVGGADAATDMYPTQGLMSPPVQDTVSEVDTDTAEPAGGTEEGLMQGPELYPSNEGSVKTYARDMYPDNPQAAAALAATIQFEGMERSEEDVSRYSWGNITNSNSAAGFLKPSITNSNKPWARKRTAVLYKLYGGKPVTDAEGNKVPLTSALTDSEEKSIQNTLKKAGFYKGAIDGAFGTNSKKALKAWQKANDITVSGKLDTPTLTALGLDKTMKDHEGNILYEYNLPTKITVPSGEKVVDVTYNPYYRANGYEDTKVDISKEGSAGNTPGAGTYRGRGPIQITGKAVYERLAPIVEEATGVNILENPEAIVDNLEVSRAATKAYLDDVGFENLSVDAMLKVINPNKPKIVSVRKPAYLKYLEAMK